MRLQMTLVALFVACTLAGCSAKADVPDPYDGYKEQSGRTIHLSMAVVDLKGTELYPNLKANLWAFCAKAAEAGDAVSAAAIEYWTTLDTDDHPSGYEPGQCSVPGPTIRVHQGDHMIVDFCHSHIHGHTIHWHGQFVPNDMDGAPGVSQGIVPSGQCFTYDFYAYKAGTLWYHCHVDTQLHIMNGLYGLFIVEPAKGRDAPDAKDVPSESEHYLVLASARRSLIEGIPHRHKPGCLVSGTPGCQEPPVDTTPDTFLLNGHSFPDTEKQLQTATTRGTLIELKEGETIRLRILNAGSTFETIHPHGHDMEVIARDGTPLATPFWVDTLTIGPAERYDVLIHGNNPGLWMLHTHVATHETNDYQSNGGMHTMMVYDGFMDQMGKYLAQSEQPAGLPRAFPQAIPSDVYNMTRVGPLTGVASSQAPDLEAQASHTFTVDLPCAVRQIVVTVDARATSAVAQAQTGPLTVDLFGPTGDPVVDAVTIPQGQTTATLRVSGAMIGALKTGEYTAHVHGSMLDTFVTTDSVIDYYESFLQAKVASEQGGYGDCLVTPEI